MVFRQLKNQALENITGENAAYFEGPSKCMARDRHVRRAVRGNGRKCWALGVENA